MPVGRDPFEIQLLGVASDSVFVILDDDNNKDADADGRKYGGFGVAENENTQKTTQANVYCSK